MRIINFNKTNNIEKLYEFFKSLKAKEYVLPYILFGYKLYNDEINNKKFYICKTFKNICLCKNKKLK